MDLSIIIPVYNAEKYISNCLESLINQRLDNYEYEIIVINDGSVDNSLSICSKYKSLYPFIKVYTINNSGTSTARNTGIKYSTGKYIQFVDSDDYITHNSLKFVLEKALFYNLDISGFNFQRTKLLNLTEHNFVLHNQSEYIVVDGILYLKNDFYYKDSSCWYMVRKEFLSEINLKFTDGVFTQDALFTIKLFLSAQRIGHLPINIYRYVIVNDSIWNKKESKHLVKRVEDLIFITLNFNKVMTTVKDKDAFDRLKLHCDMLLRNILKAIYKSSLSIDEIKAKLNLLEKEKLYPLDSYFPQNHRQLKTFAINSIFGTKVLFINIMKLKRLFSN